MLFVRAGSALVLLLLLPVGPAFGQAVPSEPGLLESADRPPAWNVRGELLVWWLRSGRLPPLVTTGPEASAGVLGRPGVLAVYGDENIDTNRHLGTRLTLQRWLDEEQNLGLKAGFFFVERNSRNFQAESPGTLLLARPFFNAATGDLDAAILAGQAGTQPLRAGGFDGLSKIELFGEEAALVAALVVSEQARLDFSAGAYFLQMRERLDLKASHRVPADASLLGVADRFRVHDRFYGGQVGLVGEAFLGGFFLQGRGLIAFGANERVLKTRADSVAQTPAQRLETPLGFLVQPSNLGSFRDTTPDVVFEVGANLGYEVTASLRVYAGYTLIRWQNTIRAGDQIDPTLPRPGVPFRQDYFWAQGVNCGLELRW